MQEPQLPEKRSFIVATVETLVFGSRWFLTIQNLGLVVALGVYTIKFAMALLEFIMGFTHMNEGETMLAVLGLLDVYMMGNLVSMIVIGSYSAFVRKLDFANFKDRPQGYSQLNSGMLKVKMAASLVSVSAIHLLKKFIDVSENHINAGWGVLSMLLAIHIAFILSLYYLAKVDQMTHAPETTHA